MDLIIPIYKVVHSMLIIIIPMLFITITNKVSHTFFIPLPFHSPNGFISVATPPTISSPSPPLKPLH